MAAAIFRQVNRLLHGVCPAFSGTRNDSKKEFFNDLDYTKLSYYVV